MTRLWPKVAKPEISIPRPISPAIFQKIHYQMRVMAKRTLAIAALLAAFLSLPASGVAQGGGERQRAVGAIECQSPTVTDGDSLRCSG